MSVLVIIILMIQKHVKNVPIIALLVHLMVVKHVAKNSMSIHQVHAALAQIQIV